MGLFDIKQLKCKTCGEPLDMNTATDGVVICGVCDSRFTLPKVTAEQKVLDYLFQAEGDLDTGRFEEAYTKYSKAAELDKTEPEAYFGMALAEHRIQYLKDEVNNRLQPVCHEISDSDFSESPNFLKALRYATEAQRAEYERKAEEINYIKNEFYKIAKSGVKYDCFICVKVSDENGGRTQDYKTADDIYFELKGKGYKPFFSERELVGVTGADYEARILYALYSSECMLVVCFDEGYLRTKWVKNEYTRFLKLVNDEEKESDSIALVFNKKPIEKLPNKKGKIQGIAINSLTAMERIVSFVDNHTPEAKKRREEEKRAREEAAKRKAAEDEELRKKLAEQEERFKQLEEMFKAQQEARKAEEERAKNEAAAAAARQTPAPKATPKATENPYPQSARQSTPKSAPADNSSFVIERGVLKRYGGRAKSIGIPEGVAEIANYAFDNGTIISVDISGRVKKIGNYAFNNCGALVNATLANGVSEIGNYAFNNCKSLESVNIPNSIKTVGNYAFYNCSSLKDVQIESAGRIGNYAFYNCPSLKNIVIPDSISEIGNNAFNIYNLESVTMPARFKGAVKNIFGVDLQNYSGRCRFTFTGEIPSLVDTVKNKITDGAKRIADEAKKFADDMARQEKEKKEAERRAAEERIKREREEEAAAIGRDFDIDPNGVLRKYKGKGKDVTVPRGVKSIGINAFTASYVEKVTLPVGVTEIGDRAFSSCGTLKSIVIPETVSYIGVSAFENCALLVRFDLPYNLSLKVRLCDNAFKGCSGLRFFVTNNRISSIGEGAFDGCFGLQTIMGVRYVDNWVVGCDKSLTKIIFGKQGIKGIGGGAFSGCKGLTDIVIPDGVETIGNGTFSGCAMLNSVKLPKSVKYIGDGAFSNCISLKSIKLPNGVKQIGGYAFACCTSLKDMSIPNGITHIVSDTFSGCTNLKSIDIPNSVAGIGMGAFKNCKSLKSISIPKGAAPADIYGASPLKGCTGLKQVTVPKIFWDYIDEETKNILEMNKCKFKFTD